MPVEIRHARDEELFDYVEALTTDFLERPDVAKVTEEIRPLWDLDRTWAAVDGDRICATFRSWDTELTVPGLARLPASAVSAVTVLPTHRRRGNLRRMNRGRACRDARARGVHRPAVRLRIPDLRALRLRQRGS